MIHKPIVKLKYKRQETRSTGKPSISIYVCNVWDKSKGKKLHFTYFDFSRYKTKNNLSKISGHCVCQPKEFSKQVLDFDRLLSPGNIPKAPLTGQTRFFYGGQLFAFV